MILKYRFNSFRETQFNQEVKLLLLDFSKSLIESLLRRCKSLIIALLRAAQLRFIQHTMKSCRYFTPANKIQLRCYYLTTHPIGYLQIYRIPSGCGNSFAVINKICRCN